MVAPTHTYCVIIVLLAVSVVAGKMETVDALEKQVDFIGPKKVDMGSGIYLEVPAQNDTSKKLLSFGFEPNKDVVEGRGKRKKLMQRLLPLFIMPFIIQSTLVPMFLGMLKFMLFKSMMVGKLALAMIILNAFKNHNSFKGRKDEQIANNHYGYHGNGMEEYGAYVNRY